MLGSGAPGLRAIGGRRQVVSRCRGGDDEKDKVPWSPRLGAKTTIVNR